MAVQVDKPGDDAHASQVKAVARNFPLIYPGKAPVFHMKAAGDKAPDRVKDQSVFKQHRKVPPARVILSGQVYHSGGKLQDRQKKEGRRDNIFGYVTGTFSESVL